MKLSPLLSQKRTVLLWLLFLFAIERLSLPPERGHNFIVIPGRFSHNTKSADAIFCLSTSMVNKRKLEIFLWFFDMNFRLDQSCLGKTKDFSAISKEKSIVTQWRQQTSKKRFTSGKSFVFPVVDSMVQANSEEPIVITTQIIIKNRIHMK